MRAGTETALARVVQVFGKRSIIPALYIQGDKFLTRDV